MSEAINKKEKLLLEYMLGSKETFARCFKILKPEYFDQPLDRVVEVIIDFFVSHRGLPTVDIVEAETGVLLKERFVGDHEVSYLLEEIEEHCKREAMAIAILAGADKVSEGDLGGVEALVREALMVKIDSDLGMDFFENVEDRIRLMDQNVVHFSSGIAPLDTMVGYLHRGELGMLFAVSSGGKSIAMANIALSLAKQQLDVCIISLEMNEFISAKRMDVMLTGEDIGAHGDNAETIATKVAEERQKNDMGKITIKQMLPFKTTASTIRAYLMEYNIVHGKFPDALVVDYAKLMGVDQGKRESVSEQDNERTIELRAIAVEYDMIVVSAGQVNREGQDVIALGPQHISGGIVMINNSDWSIGLTAREENIENGEVMLCALKQRNAAKDAGLHVLYRCPKSLRLSDKPFSSVRATTSPLHNAAKKKKTVSASVSDVTGKSGKDRLRAALKI